jgi:hypothetical protein
MWKKSFALLPLLAACDAVPLPAVEAPPPRAVGGERDEHGCLGAAGYTWCTRENACVRPWELAAEKGFKLEAFQHYCDGDKK